MQDEMDEEQESVENHESLCHALGAMTENDENIRASENSHSGTGNREDAKVEVDSDEVMLDGKHGKSCADLEYQPCGAYKRDEKDDVKDEAGVKRAILNGREVTGDSLGGLICDLFVELGGGFDALNDRIDKVGGLENGFLHQ